MGKPVKTRPVKLITGIIAFSDSIVIKCERALIKAFGKIDFKSPKFDFNYTDYYNEEMGTGLIRYFFSFEKLVPPSQLAGIKILTNAIESKLAVRRPGKNMISLRRRVNIDPGYINDAKLILASTKDYFHRIYLSKGIYAENTLFFQRGSFRPFDWTYPDYRAKDYICALNHIRSIFMGQRSDVHENRK